MNLLTEDTGKMLLGGERVDATDGQVFAVRNPATGEVLAEVPKAGPEDVRRAIEIARKGRTVMAALPAHRRSDILRKASELIASRIEELTLLLTQENGKTIRQCRFEMETTRRLFLDFSEEAKRIRGHYLPMDAVPGLESMVAYTIRQPVGIVLGIIPFNYPVELFAHKIPGAIAAGASSIVKLPEQCPLTLLKIGDILFEAGLPPEGMQMLTGFPQDLGDELITHPDVSLISFTGSAATARKISAKASGGLKRLALELGGTDAMIVLEDADIDEAVSGVVQGRLTNGAGQICCAVKRVLVHQSIYDDFISKLVDSCGKIKMGDPLDDETDLGPLITPEAADVVERQVEAAVTSGARCLAGGKRVGRSYFEPTVLVDVTPAMPIVKDEVFGPIAPISSFQNLEEAIEVANDSEYGLQASVYTRSVSEALKVAHRLEVGGVVINGPSAFRPGNVPFGGMKQSGIGRESIVETVLEMTELKTIVINGAL